MTSGEGLPSAADLLREASEWHLLSLLLSRPTPERKREVRELANEAAEPRLAKAASAWCEHAREGAYLHLLGPGGLVPAREVAYLPFADPGGLLADISRFHRAFAFTPACEEPADHVAVLADFVAYLRLKEAYARERGDHEAAEVTRGASERFTAAHLAPVVLRLAERLDASGATAWSAAAHLLAERVPAPPPAVEGPLDDEAVVSCGACSAVRSDAG
jgi:nitrate reductase assembly molybdenum cofactor insertion protein NarJ